MPSIKPPNGSALGAGNSRGQELGKYEETPDEQVEKRQGDEVSESLLADLAESPFDAHHIDVEAAMILLELARGHRIPAESSTTVTSNGGVPLHQNNTNESVSGTDGPRAAQSFAGAHMPDSNTEVPANFEDTQAAVILFSAHLDQCSSREHMHDSNPADSASFEDTQAAVTLYSIYLDQARSRQATLE